MLLLSSLRERSIPYASLQFCLCFAIGLCGTVAHAMVPPSERAVLDEIYYGTGGIPPGGGSRTWINITGWGLPPFLGISECTSYGVSFILDHQGQEHISEIKLDQNGLTGELPSSLSALSYLRVFSAYGNDIGGSIPTLTGLADLENVDLYDNQLTGAIPSLAGLLNLASIDVRDNQLSGVMPPLDGLVNLWIFRVSSNQLTGTIPTLSGLTFLYDFNVNSNKLTGEIPSLTGLLNLRYFQARNNRLSGTIPDTTGANLDTFVVSNNLLTGPLPTTVTQLHDLEYFDAANNLLTGPIPPLTALMYLQDFYVGSNRLTGLVPLAPPSLASASLCPNPLTTTSQPGIDPAWDAATGNTPWWATPSLTNRCDDLFNNAFEVVFLP